MLKSLFYVLAGLSHCDAARSKLAETRSAANVMGELSSMLQQRGYATKILRGLQQLAVHETPQSFSDILAAVIDQLEADVEEKIKTDFKATQDVLSDAIEKLENSTSTALSMASDADLAHQSWFSCIGEEKTLLEAQEEASESLTSAQAAEETPCNTRDQLGSTPFMKTLELAGFQCDVSVASNCASALTAYNSTLQSMLTDLQDDLSDAQELYTQYVNECESAKSHTVAMTTALTSATTSFNNKKSECLVKHEVRSTSICMFGGALQVKCGAAVDFQDLVDASQATGGVHSDVDRQAEWKTVSVTKCMLQKVMAGTELSNEALSECESAVNYQGDVGILDTFTARYDADAATLGCASTGQFQGETWTTGETSDSYEVVAFSPAFDKDNAAAPFSLCAASVAEPGKETS